MPDELFSRATIEAAFSALSDSLVARETQSTIVLFGDAAMMFAFDARDAIDHVDGSAKPRGLTLGAARDAATVLGLPHHWLNDQRVSSLARDHADDVLPLWTAPNLEVVSISAEQLLAMKALAPERPADLDDLRLLSERTGIKYLIDAEILVAEIFPGKTLNAKVRTTLEGVFA